jgi:hypothetical protein
MTTSVNVNDFTRLIEEFSRGLNTRHLKNCACLPIWTEAATQAISEALSKISDPLQTGKVAAKESTELEVGSNLRKLGEVYGTISDVCSLVSNFISNPPIW